jgi:hypothetical protein
MFGFSRARHKIKNPEEIAEERLLNDLKASLGDEQPMITVLKNRLRIIDLEDKVIKLERYVKRLASGHKNIIPKKGK